MEFFIEAFHRAHHRLEVDRGNDIGMIQAVLHFFDDHYRMGAHKLGAVDQGQPLFWPQLNGLHAQLLQDFFGRLHTVAAADSAHSDEWKKKVRQRRQIARSTDRSLFRDTGDDILIDMPNDPPEGVGRNPGVAFCQRMRFQDQHQFGDLSVDRISDANAVAHQKVVLQRFRVLLVDPGGTQRAKPSVNAVNDPVIADNIGDDPVALTHFFACSICQYAFFKAADQPDCPPNSEQVFTVPKFLKQTFFLHHLRFFQKN